MKHKVKILVETEKRGFLGVKKTALEEKAVEVDGKTYKKMKQKRRDRPYLIGEMVFYDWLFGDD